MTVIATIAAAFAAAWLFGLLTERLGLSPIVGYLLAGVAIGPHTPGFVGDMAIAQQLAEVGVILLMFGVGLHFHVDDLLRVKNVAVPGAVVQSLVATLAAVAIFSAFGIPPKSGAVIGMAMAVASTVVLMRVLMDADMLNTRQGHVAVGWLVVEDIFTVVLLVLIPVLGEPGGGGGHGAAGSLWAGLGLALLKLCALVAILLVAGARVVPWILQRVARLRSRELFTLTVLVFSITVASGAYFLFGASMALGAFLAGMVVGQSPVSHQAAADALPLRDAFAVLFFVSVGMIFDPAFLLQAPWLVVAGLGVVLLVKPLAALLIVAVLGYSARTALTVALGLAQIGEFSFILSQLAREHGLLPEAGYNVVIASAILSIALNPILFRALPRIESWLRGRPRLWSLLNRRAELRARAVNATAAIAAQGAGPKGVAIVVGYGPVGRAVNQLLKDADLATVVIDLNSDTVSALKASGAQAVYGDASHGTILEAAGVRAASHLLVTLPSATDRAAVVATARDMNPKLRIFARARYLRERESLEGAGVAAAVFEEAEAAVGLARLVLADTGVRREAAEEKVRDLRLQLIRENLATIRAQHVRSVMVPWSGVQWLPLGASKERVLALVARERFSRWPVVDLQTGAVAGYLLAKDLIAEGAKRSDWTKLVRSLETVGPDEDVESTLVRMQAENASVYLVTNGQAPLGLVTREDILEQVVGRIEDEYPHEAELTVGAAVSDGGVVLDLQGATPAQVIRELAGAVPRGRLPAGVDVAALALAREEVVSTDLGNGVAVPHARCPGLARPLAVFGRSREGVLFSTDTPDRVHLVFLLVTPAESPDTQLALLAKVARLVGDPNAREHLMRAGSPAEVLEVLWRSHRADQDPAQRSRAQAPAEVGVT